MRLVVEWTFATTVAVVAAHLAIEIAGAALLGWTLILLFPLVGGAIGGLPIGVAQWIVLRRYVDVTTSWITVTLLGFLAAWWLAVALAAVAFRPQTGIGAVAAFVCFALSTPVIGLVQWRVLRRWTSRLAVWIAANTLGWSAFMAVELFATHALPQANEAAGRLVSAAAGYLVASSVGATIAGGLCAGAITGAALARILPAERR